jgi:hypothetical protein
MREGLGTRTIARVAALCCVVLFAAAPAAHASDWIEHPLTGEGAEAQLFGMSCPTTSMCVGVGGNNTIATSTDPMEPGTWNTFFVAEGVFPGAPNQRQLKGISCPSEGMCVAVSFLGRILTSTAPTAGPSAWAVDDFDPSGPNIHFYDVSCPSTTFCVAVAAGGVIATSTDPLGGPEAWTITQLPQPLELRGVSCTSPSFCVVVGDNGTEIKPFLTNVAEVLSSTAPAAGVWSQTELPGPHGPLFGVSCPTTGFCLAGDMYGNAVGTTAPTGPASGWSSFSAGASVQITGVGCTSPEECLMVDDNGDALTSADPLGGTGAWTVQNIVPYSTAPLVRNAFFSVSCPAAKLCAIGGTGEALTSANPSAPPPAATQVGAKGKKPPKHKLRPRRPRALLLAGQSDEVPIRKGKALLQFRFYVKPKFQVRGYVCSFGHAKLRRCRSPRRYRVGPGHHRFRVRAVGWTGLRGPVAQAKVWVCRRSEPTASCHRHPSR